MKRLKNFNRFVVQKETPDALLIFVILTRQSLYDYVESCLKFGFSTEAPELVLHKETEEVWYSRERQTELARVHGGVEGYIELSKTGNSAIVCVGKDWHHGRNSFWHFDGETVDCIE